MSNLNNKIIHGDALAYLKTLPEGVVDFTVTSPPYFNAREYSQYLTYEDYLSFMGQVFKQVHRVTKEGGFVAINTSPVLEARVSRAHQSYRRAIPFDMHPILQNMGWMFIEDIIWVKPEASVKNRNAGFMRHRKPMAYKPNVVTEYIMVYRKRTHRLIDWNIHSYPDDVVKASLVTDPEPTNVWEMQPERDRVHPAVFPQQLPHKLINYYSYVGDLVLDPFAGSGRTGLAARRSNRHFLLIEQNETYIERMKELFGYDTIANPEKRDS